MNHHILSSEDIEKLREPLDWRDLSNESPLVTQEKIKRAKELGVAAVIFTADQVTSRIKELALLEHSLRNGKMNDTVYAVILKGGVQFATPLFRNIASLSPNVNPVVDYIQASRYGNSQQGDRLQIIRKLDPKTEINGKRTILIDDTVDEGITMELTAVASRSEVDCRLLGEGITGPAGSVGLIALTDKRIANLDGFNSGSAIRGLWIPNAWGGGNGLDGPNEAMRWVPETVLTAVQHEKYRETLPEILDTLGERAVMTMDDFIWVS